MAERFADRDRSVSKKMLACSSEQILAEVKKSNWRSASSRRRVAAINAVGYSCGVRVNLVHIATEAAIAASSDGAVLCSNEKSVQAHLIRDVFGATFVLPVFDPRWRTSDAVGLARAIYEDRAFERLPILADALMDAGCEDEQIISHCRSDGPHVRGCWVVDLVLDKK